MISETIFDFWRALRWPLILVAVVAFIYTRLQPQKQAEPVIPKSEVKGPKRISGKKDDPKRASQVSGKNEKDLDGIEQSSEIQIYIFFSSLTGATEKYAQQLAKDLFASPLYIPAPAPPREITSTTSTFLPAIVHNVDYLDLDEFFTKAPSHKSIYLILLPSYNITSPVDVFLQHLEETHHDFRIDNKPLRSLEGFSVFGFGDTEYPEGMGGGYFCGQAKEADKWMAKLTGGKRIFPLGMGDVRNKAQDSMNEWRQHLEVALQDHVSGEVNDAILDSDEEEEEEKPEPSKLVDLEDLGKNMKKISKKSKSTKSSEVEVTTKEMVPKNSPTYNALTKQGYTIVGSHSGVKLCRWTKSALRGRGSCYKFSFYGIKSYLCMETTPSLSCSNKCVFCWRHGTNPVSTSWKWVVDQPEDILQGVMEGHYKKIKMMKGVPGIRADRFAEAFTIRHCALSLVGEPIFYPYINEFLGMLHERRISSFLVCNAQHPDQLAALKHVTQLYVSIDASNKESLRKIDRPLHRDFWERFQRCLDILREKRHTMRTVFRLTLVKGFNVEEEVEGYANLVEKALPSFVEVKGVTYCGTSTSVGAGLTMQNVPFYEEVTDFVIQLNAALKRRGLNYGIGAEHAHSCCVLLASDDYYIDGKWHTLIDYAKFFELLESGVEFGPLDYVGEATPEWATWGNGGFDPADLRVYTKGKNKGKVVGPNGELVDAKELQVENVCS